MAFALGPTNIPTLVVSVAIIIIVGIYVFSAFTGAISQQAWSASANSTYTQVQTNTWNAFLLTAISVIVLAAVGILGLVVRGLTGA